MVVGPEKIYLLRDRLHSCFQRTLGGLLGFVNALVFLIFFLAASPHCFAQTSSHLIDRLLSVRTFEVTREGDGNSPGMFRTILLESIEWRKQHPFERVRIRFHPTVKVVRLLYGPLPPIEVGGVSLEGDGKVRIDGSVLSQKFSPSLVEGITLRSDGNSISGLSLIGFSGRTVVVEGKWNTIALSSYSSENQSLFTPVKEHDPWIRTDKSSSLQFSPVDESPKAPSIDLRFARQPPREADFVVTPPAF